MIGASFGVTGAAAGGLPRRRRSRRRAARASVAARRSAHGGRESRAGADASLGAFGAATTAAAGTAARTVARGAVSVAADTVTGRRRRRPLADVPPGTASARSLLLRPRRRARLRRARPVCVPVDRRLADAGRATSSQAPLLAGAVPRTASFAGDDSAGAGSTTAGADCRAGVAGVGAAAGGGAGGRGGEQRQWVHVAARIVGTAGSQLDVWNRGRLTGRRDRPDRLALRHAVPDRDDHRTELRERDGPAVRGPDRDGAAVRRQRPGERDPSRGGGQDVRADRPGDVDSPMPGGRVRTAAVVESTDDLAGSPARSTRRPVGGTSSAKTQASLSSG